LLPTALPSVCRGQGGLAAHDSLPSFTWPTWLTLRAAIRDIRVTGLCQGQRGFNDGGGIRELCVRRFGGGSAIADALKPAGIEVWFDRSERCDEGLLPTRMGACGGSYLRYGSDRAFRAPDMAEI
jgi:hypothetical protein